MTRADASELRRLRLAAQGLGADEGAVARAAHRLLAVQAQDLPSARWALGVRARGSVDADVTDALDSGALVRHWPLRGTLQLVARDDLRWLLGLTAERQWAASARVLAQWGVDDATLAAAREASVAALAGGRTLGRAELAARIESVGVAMTGGRGYQLIYALALTGTLCFAETAGAGQRLALLDEWVPQAAPVDRDEALARLVGRYLRGHGPATAADLAWWAGIPLSWVRRGADAAAARTLEVDGTDYLALAEDDADRGVFAGILLLPAFDEYLLGYRARGAMLEARHAQRVAPRANGRFLPIVVDAGRVVGTWRDAGARAAVEWFEGARSAGSLARAFAEYRRFRDAASLA